MGDISKHFSTSEIECHCGCGFADVQPEFLEALEELREAYGKSIVPSCVCRCATHNASLPGHSTTSKHMDGMAIDIPCQNSMEAYSLLIIALKIPAFHNGGKGFYDWGIHLDTGHNRMFDRRTKK